MYIPGNVLFLSYSSFTLLSSGFSLALPSSVLATDFYYGAMKATSALKGNEEISSSPSFCSAGIHFIILRASTSYDASSGGT
jgi:hypothetical protein